MSVLFIWEHSFLLPFIIGGWRWGIYIFLKLLPATLYKAKPITNEIEEGHIPVSTNMITMVCPVYMPEPGFKDCFVTWVKSNPAKLVLAVDKKSYDEVIQITNKVINKINPKTPVYVIKVEEPGKRTAMFEGLKHVETEIVVFHDDDSLFNPNLLRSLVQPFSDPMMGGVGTKQVARPKGENWSIWDIFMDMIIYQRTIGNKATSYMGGGASCISGRAMAFRTCLFKTDDFEDKFMNEWYTLWCWPFRQLSGDDKCLTRIAINTKGYKMYHQICKDCTLSTRFESGRTLIKQLTRWARNSWRSDIKLLFVEWTVWRKYPMLAITLIDRMLTPFCVIYGPIIVIYYTIVRRNMFILVAFLIYLIITRAIKAIFYFRSRPRRPLWWIFIIPLFVIFQFFCACLRIWALLTLSNGTWGNRSVKVGKDGNVVRTGEFKDDEKSENKDIILEINNEQEKEEENDDYIHVFDEDTDEINKEDIIFEGDETVSIQQLIKSDDEMIGYVY